MTVYRDAQTLSHDLARLEARVAKLEQPATPPVAAPVSVVGDEACERCDDPMCDVPAARAAWQAASPGRGEDAAGAGLDAARAECRSKREEVNWRDRAKKLQAERDAALRESERLRHGATIEGDAVCGAELRWASVKPLIEEVRAIRQHMDDVHALRDGASPAMCHAIAEAIDPLIAAAKEGA